jgi:hypothetical protein
LERAGAIKFTLNLRFQIEFKSSGLNFAFKIRKFDKFSIRELKDVKFIETKLSDISCFIHIAQEILFYYFNEDESEKRSYSDNIVEVENKIIFCKK